MRVLFLVYPHIGLGQGGLQLQIQRTAAGLLDAGVEVVFYDPWTNGIEEADVCHVFGFLSSMRFHVSRAKACGKPVVISPVLNVFSFSRARLRLQVFLSNAVPGMLREWRHIQRMLRECDQVIALNVEERNILTRYFGVQKHKCTVIPNGLDLRMTRATPERARTRLGFDDYVLSVGSICQRKNQLTLIRAMRGLPHRLVLVGGATQEDAAYYRACRSEAGDNVHFLGAVDNENSLLPSLYAAARLFVLPSFSEVMPLTLYEAALSGCRVVASRNFPISKELKGCARRVPPRSVKCLRRVIREEMGDTRHGGGRRAITDMASWKTVTDDIRGVYAMLCKHCERVET